jgi:glycosyltransferase involved in cell wall biosynthesis
MREDPCDLIHANWTYEFALAALGSGKPTLVTAHDAPFRVLRYSRDAYRALRTLMALNVARTAGTMTAVSADIAGHFRRFLGHREPIDVIPNFLSDEVFALGADRMERRQTGPVFASVLTGWGKMKNGAAALQAFASVRERFTSSKLLMFGTGFEENAAAHLWASRKGLTCGVEFIGSVPHSELLKRLADEVDVLVHPSLVEALSVSVMEGMALGLPVIAGEQTGGMKYLLEGGQAGVLVDVGSVPELAEAMIQLGCDSSLRQRFGVAGRKSALLRFRADIVIPQYERVYARVLAESRSKAKVVRYASS